MFLVLRKMTNDEFETDADFLEQLFITQSLEFGMGVYNKNNVERNITSLTLWHHGVETSMRNAIKSNTRRQPGTLRLVSPAGRLYLQKCFFSEGKLGW